MKSRTSPAATDIYALVFGLFLGLCILKFGNPVILDQKIFPPANFSEFWQDAWPIEWANWIFWPLAAIGAILIVEQWNGHSASARDANFSSGARKIARSSDGQAGSLSYYARWLFLLPLLWLGWQMISAARTVDVHLTAVTLWQFFGCVASYFIGRQLIRSPRALQFLFIGILVAFTICLVRAIQQRFEFPQDQKFLLEGQREGWTNVPPAMLLEMKRDQTIITTNGVDVVNPAIAARFGKDRVMGTMVYPNALAGVILLLFPVSLVLAFSGTKKLRPVVRAALIGLTVGLSGVAFFWSGSKLGWLIAIFMGALCLFRLRWPTKLKIFAIAIVVLAGMGVFAARFHTYFAKGATSATARLDYWRAAAQTTCSHPLFGTGPGTFQRPYAKLKSPDAEMARLAHNDYLEQFSDSGVPGGIFYAAWIIMALVFTGKKIWPSRNQNEPSVKPVAAAPSPPEIPDSARHLDFSPKRRGVASTLLQRHQIFFALFLGLLGWFIQALGEFGLFIPASAWMAFTFLGSALGFAKAVDSEKK